MKTKTQPIHTQGKCTTRAYALELTQKGVNKYFCDILIGKRTIFCAYGVTIQEAEANALRIVKAVNMHDEFVMKLKDVIDLCEVFLPSNDLRNLKIKEKIESAKQLLKQAEQK